jgi:hypothetical protein
MGYVVSKHYAAHSSEEPRELWKEILLFCGALEAIPVLGRNGPKLRRLITQIPIQETFCCFNVYADKMRICRWQHVARELHIYFEIR